MHFKIRLCALNDDSSEESEPEPTQESVKQAKVGEGKLTSIKLILYNVNLSSYSDMCSRTVSLLLNSRIMSIYLTVQW